MFNGFSLALIALSPEGGSLIDVNPGLIFWTVITFLVLLFVLKKIAWKPILTALDQREAAIKESLEKAEKAKEEAQKVLDQNQSNLAQAEEEAKKIVNQSRDYAEKMKEQILSESREEAKKIIADATAEIDRKRDAAFDELKSYIAEIAVQAAEKLLKEKLDPASNKKIVDKYIEEIRNN